MEGCAFISLEDISGALPRYREEVVCVSVEEPLRSAYVKLRTGDFRVAEAASRQSKRVEHNAEHASVATRMILTAWARYTAPNTTQKAGAASISSLRKRWIWTSSYAMRKRALIHEIKTQLARGRRCQIFAVYTSKHDVTAQLELLLRAEGIRTAVLRAGVPSHKREAWYREQQRGVDVVVDTQSWSRPALIVWNKTLLAQRQ